MLEKILLRLAPLKGIIQRALEIWCFTCCTLILSIVLYQVSARYCAHKPLLWAQGTCQLLLMHMVFLGATMAFVNRSHIAIDLITSRLSEKRQYILGVFKNAFMVVLLAFYSFCIFKVLIHTRGIYPNPTVPMRFFYLPVFVGAILAWVIVTIDFMELLAYRSTGHASTATGGGLNA